MARILVVDDQNIPRAAVAGSLIAAGHEVQTAGGGEEGLRVAREWCPDVIVLDVYMPGMDGFQVVEKLKEDPVTEPMPVIFLTAEPPSEDVVVRGLDLGAYDFLTKDCSRAELLARVGVMARIKRGTDELSAVARISDSLIQSLDPEQVSRRFVSQVREVFRAQAVLLVISAEEGEAPLCTADGLDISDPLFEPLIRALLERVTAAGSNPADVDLTEFRGPEGVLVRRLGLRSAVVARLERDDRPPIVLGVMMEREEGLGRSTDAPLLSVLARQASIALDNALLHVRTRDQARKMEEQAEKLEKAMSERSRFFASMSHEIRTPINAVIGYNQLLQMGSFGEMTPAQAKAVESVGRSAQHLLELINDVLDISKIEAGKLEVLLEPVDLRLLVKDTVTSVQLQAEQKGLALEVDVGDAPTITTDAARVRQILLNLLSNAVKFTMTGGVTVRVVAGDADTRLSVSDTGPGIEPDDLERVFDEFEQTHHGHTRGGTGLGLAISRRLAHLLGGRLQLESTVGVGSTFTLCLPHEPPPAPSDEPSLDPSTAVPGM